MAFFGSGSGVQSRGVSFGGQQPEQTTAYDQYGNPVQVDEGTPIQQHQPNTGYAGTNYFEAPPPQYPGGGGGGPQSLRSIGGGGGDPATTAPLIQADNQGSARAGGIGQDAFEGERMLGLSADLQRQAEERRVGMLTQFSRETASPRVGGGGGPSGDETAARAAAFAAAKERPARQHSRVSVPSRT